jgi:hypothetical protein
LVFFLYNQRFQEHDRSCFPLWALDVLEEVDQFPYCFVIVVARRE